MILPIIAYGDPILKKSTIKVPENYPNLKKLIADMFETMTSAKGIGLAASQIGKPLKLFIIDCESVDKIKYPGFKKTFINAQILEENGEMVTYNEGCLSVPTIREEIERPEIVKVQYFDEDFNLHEEEFNGLPARVIQHEHDHTDGILFTDYFSAIKKRLLRNKLKDISKGNIEVDYKMKFPLAGKKITR